MEGPEPKKQRTGVGTAVAKLIEGPADPFLLVLAKTQVARLVPTKGKIICLKRDETLPRALRTMIDNNILSCMVLTKKDDLLHGYIEMEDILRWVIRHFHDLPLDRVPEYSLVVDKQPEFERTTIGDVIKTNRGKVNPYHPLAKEYSLMHAWEILAHSGAHRIPIIDENFHIWDVTTQSMLIDFLWQNLEKIGNFAKRPIGTVFPTDPKAEVHHVQKHSKGITGFRIMFNRNVHGLAVVEHGKLVDIFSQRDLKVVYTDANELNFKILWEKNIGEIKEIIRSKFDRAPQELLYVTPTDTFENLIEKMATKHVHRIFVVNDKTHMHPIRCISQTDVLNEVFNAK